MTCHMCYVRYACLIFVVTTSCRYPELATHQQLKKDSECTWKFWPSFGSCAKLIWKHKGTWGWGIYGSNGWVKWAFIFERYAQKALVFRGVPILVITLPWASVPLISRPVAYSRKGVTTPPLKLVWGPQLLVGFHSAMTIQIIEQVGGGVNGWSYHNIN